MTKVLTWLIVWAVLCSTIELLTIIIQLATKKMATTSQVQPRFHEVIQPYLEIVDESDSEVGERLARVIVHKFRLLHKGKEEELDGERVLQDELFPVLDQTWWLLYECHISIDHFANELVKEVERNYKEYPFWQDLVRDYVKSKTQSKGLFLLREKKKKTVKDFLFTGV